MTYILQTNHMTKSIGKKELVRDVNIHIKRERFTDFWDRMGLVNPLL